MIQLGARKSTWGIVALSASARRVKRHPGSPFTETELRAAAIKAVRGVGNAGVALTAEQVGDSKG